MRWVGMMSRRAALRLGLASMACWSAMTYFGSECGRADEVAFDNFEEESLTLVPFDLDYFKPGGFSMPGEFDGWSLMDVESWIAHAGIQAGRDRCLFGTAQGDRNVALVADPDEADDTGNTDLSGDYNSYITRTYDITGATLTALELSFDFDFITDGSQRGVVDVSFDGGATWQSLLDMTDDGRNGSQGRDDLPFGTDPSIGDSGTFTAVDGDFTPPGGATEMQVRFGCIEAGNNWWFCVDNIGLTDGAGLNIFEDFETTEILDTMEPMDDVNTGDNDGYTQDGTDWTKVFPAGWILDNSQSGYPTEFDGPDFQPSDGTDWTRDLSSIGWTIINDGPADFPESKMYFETAEGAYNGGAVLDAFSWAYQTDSDPPEQADITNINTGWGQERSMFRAAFFGQRNQVLVFDPDQAYDDVIPESVEKDPPGYNSYAHKTYDVGLFDNGTLTVSFEWEVRVERPQINVLQVSFNGGTSWTTIWELDSNILDNEDIDPADFAAFQAEFSPFLAPDFDGGDIGVVNQGDVLRTFEFGAPQTIVLSGFFPNDFVPNSNTMQFRVGCINADNDWWFAVDDIRIEADAQAFIYGDTNGDGVVNNGDLAGAIAAFQGAYDVTMDFNEDGVVNNGDLGGFINAFQGN